MASLARTILDDPSGGFTARILTRHPTSERARALASRGAEIAEANLDDGAAVQRAFTGAASAFCVTNYWEHFSPIRATITARGGQTFEGAQDRMPPTTDEFLSSKFQDNLEGFVSADAARKVEQACWDLG